MTQGTAAPWQLSSARRAILAILFCSRAQHGPGTVLGHSSTQRSSPGSELGVLPKLICMSAELCLVAMAVCQGCMQQPLSCGPCVKAHLGVRSKSSQGSRGEEHLRTRLP